MKTLCTKCSAISALLFSFLLLTSPFLAATETFSKERVTENSEISSDQLKADQWSKNEANTTSFIENKGQVLDMEGQPAPYVDYMLDRGSTQIFLLGEAGIAWQFKRVHYPDGYEELHSRRGDADDDFLRKRREMNEQVRTETYRMDMVLEGANPNATASTEGKSADYFNYYNADALEVHHFEQVTYHDVYPGIDWVVYTSENGLKYDFIVHPGADPNQIKLKFRHHEELYLDDEGNLIHGNRMGSFTEFAPVSFQHGQEIPTEFILQDDVLRFELGEYNSNETLIIDPARIWATYYGDTGADDAKATAVDGSDSVYLVGSTTSFNNIASGGHQNTYVGGQMAYLVKFNASGVRQWATYYGGSGSDFGESCATDLDNNVFLAGYTTSTSNIASSGHQNTKGGGEFDGFLAKFNASGVLQWGTYYGGEETDAAFGCTTDSDGNVYLVGATQSTSGIAVGGHQTIYAGGSEDAFLVKFNSSGVRQWGTYYGGSGEDRGWSCATDASNNVFITGWTESISGIADGGHQNTYGGGGEDAFLVKFSSSGVRLWGTYYGGTSFERARSCATDASGNVYIVGETASASGISFNGHQNTKTGPQDAFVAKFDADGVRLWGTYYGGDGTEVGFGCKTDGEGNVFFTGGTNSENDIASGGFQNTIGGGYDAYLVKFNSSGVRQWGTYYGASGSDSGFGCAVDSEDNVYLAGRTMSTEGGLASGGHQNTYGGGLFDAFLAKFEGSSPSTPCIHSLVHGFASAPTDNTPVVATTCAPGGGYIEINSAVSGESYEFASSIATDWLVLTDDADNVLLEGTTPINWTATFNGTVHLHISEDSDCNTDGGCRQPTVTCTTCSDPPCVHPIQYESVFAPADTIPVMMSECIYAGEFNVITDVVVDKTYIFSSSESTDWLVLTDNVNNVLVEGTTPISWTATFNGTVLLHVSTDADCGTENSCRETTVQCITCLAFASCVHPVDGGSGFAPTNTLPTMISSCVSAGQYNTVNNIVSGQTYQFSSSTSTDWLLLTDEANNFLAEGTTPISWTASYSGAVRLHVSANANCGTGGLCRTTTVECTSCPLPIGCIHATPFGEAAAPADDAPLEITNCIFPGEYSTITNVVSGETYQFSSSTGTDWLVLSDDDENLLVEGSSPIIWTADFSGTIRLHVSTDSDCGTENLCRETILQCTSCMVLPTSCCADPLPGPGCPQYPDCENEICAFDPFCCISEWDVSCAGAATQICGASLCTPAACVAPTLSFNTVTDCIAGTYMLSLNIGSDGDGQLYDVFIPVAVSPACNEAQAGPGFPGDLGCETVICAADPFCCDTEWDSICASSAASEPACEGCTTPQPSLLGNFAGGTTGITIGTYPVGETVDITVLHDSSPGCNQTINAGSSDICGCTDSNAVNFDPAATQDDGSCVLPPGNDGCVNAQTLPVAAWPASSNTMGTLTGAFGSGWGACAGVDGPDVFYTFNAATLNHYIINLNAFGGFTGVLELYDATSCSGNLLECFEPDPDCGQAQVTPGFPSDLTCEAAVCGDDPFCCNDEWDSLCAGAATFDFEAECAGCLGNSSQLTSIAMDLPAGDYTLRVRNFSGATVLGASGNFLIGVQSFPTAQVQANPANFLYACNTSDRQLEEIVGASPQTGQLSGILDYEWEIHRIGGGFSNTWQRGGPNYSTKLNWLGMDYGETYNVFVRLQINVPGVGPVWGVHQVLGGMNPEDVGASTCTISTSSTVTPTAVLPQYSPTNIHGEAYQMCNIVVAQNVASAQNYEWEFDNGIDPIVYYLRGSGNPGVKLSWVDCLKPNHTYQVRVRAQVSGLWGNFGSAFAIDMAPTANTALRANMCGTTRALTQWLLPNPVCIADSYEYRLTNTTTGDVHTSISTALSGGVQLNSFSPALVPGAEYVVEVKATQCGEEGDYSSACNITIAGPQAQGDDTPAVRALAIHSATLYPNPNAGTEVRVDLSGLGDSNHEVMIQIYDIYGKLIQTEGFGHAGSAMSRLVRFDGNLAMGVYMVQIVVDGERFVTERLVIQ